MRADGRSGARDAHVPGQALPQPLSDFIGRGRELAELAALLGHVRLVTLTGPGGSGKTRLALAVAGRAAGRLGGNASFVDLAPITDAALVVSSIATTLGIRAEPRRPLLDTLVRRLTGSSRLLVLDNLEQLLPAGASPIAELLVRCPDLHVLVTSRAPLHVRGEHEYLVDPLALPEAADLASPEKLGQVDAVALFVSRARALDPHFALTVENATAVAEICRRLDGLPLAIELAAARVRLLPPLPLLRRLEHRLPLLTSGAADAPARQRTLRDTIGWSYDLLEPADKIVFARLSVFVGGFSLVAAEEIAANHDADSRAGMVDVLGRLIANSLLLVRTDEEGEPRFRLLETVREFAAEQLPESEISHARARHVGHFMLMAEKAYSQVSGPQHGVWLSRLRNDIDNLRAAFEWARLTGAAEEMCRFVVALTPFLDQTGHYRDVGAWLDFASGASLGVAPGLRATVLHILVTHELANGGDRARAERVLQESLAIYESLGDQKRAAEALLSLADIAADLGDQATARERREQALEVTRAIADPREADHLLAWLATALQSKAIAEEAIALGRMVDHPQTIATARGYLGLAALKEGDPMTAVAEFSESARIWRQHGVRGALIWATQHLGTAMARAGDPNGGRRLIKEALQGLDDLGSRYVSLCALESAAVWLGDMGRPEAAIVCWAAVDAGAAASLDRTNAHDMGLFLAARERDRLALARTRYEAAAARGDALPLDEAIEYAIRALDETELADSRDRGSRSMRRRFDLTTREREVLDLLATGQSDAQIAAALFISKKTAAVHVANIKGKLGASSRVDIVTSALRLGLVAAPGDRGGRDHSPATRG